MPSQDTLNDSDLLRLSASGDEAAFTALYRRHSGSVFRFALHMSGQKEVAEEVTQEVFLALIRDPKQYRGPQGPLEAFLIGVTRNKVRRQARRTPSFQLDEFEAGDAARALPESDPFGSFLKKDDVRALHAAILTLPPPYREVVVLCDLEEMDYADVAQLLGCVIGTVRSRLHRARLLLGAKMRSREKCSQ